MEIAASGHRGLYYKSSGKQWRISPTNPVLYCLKVALSAITPYDFWVCLQVDSLHSHNSGKILGLSRLLECQVSELGSTTLRQRKMWRRRRRHLLYIPLKKSRVSDGCLREKTSMSRYILGEGEVESRGFWAPQSFCLRFGISLDLQSRTFIQSGLVQVYL